MRKLPMLFVLLLVACSIESDDPTPLPSGQQFQGIVSFNTNLSSSESLASYTSEYQAALSAGASGAQTAAPWGSLNPTGTTYDMTLMDNPYFGLNTLKTLGYQTIFLNIPIITIDKRNMPSDIVDLSFDDPIVKSRFRTLIDVIKIKLNESVKYISLGNEVDTYFSTHANEWTAYKSLVEDARDYLHTIRADFEIGVTTTFAGASSSAASTVSNLNENMDVVMLTYYPISSNFIPRDPSSTVKTDVAKMLTLAGGKPLILQEWGYPSSTTLGSSEKKQADFFSNSFKELKENGQDSFHFVGFFKLRDWNSAHCQALTGQSAGQNFL